MTPVNEQHEIFGKQRFNDEFRVVNRQVDDGGVNMPRYQSWDQRGSTTFGDNRVYPWMTLLQFGEELWH